MDKNIMFLHNDEYFLASDQEVHQAQNIEGDDDWFRYNLWRESMFLGNTHEVSMKYAETGYFD